MTGRRQKVKKEEMHLNFQISFLEFSGFLYANAKQTENR